MFIDIIYTVVNLFLYNDDIMSNNMDMFTKRYTYIMKQAVLHLTVVHVTGMLFYISQPYM
jgi:hypothetical protein